MQMHAWLLKCVMFLALLHALSTIFIRSATDLVVWLFRRQCALTFTSRQGSVYGCYQVGRAAQMLGESLMAARFVYYFFAMFSILTIPLFSVVSLGPLDSVFQDCRNVFTTATTEVPAEGGGGSSSIY